MSLSDRERAGAFENAVATIPVVSSTSAHLTTSESATNQAMHETTLQTTRFDGQKS